MRNRIRGAARHLGSALSAVITGLLITGGLIALPYIALSDPVSNFSLSELDPPSQRTLVLYAADGRPFARRGGCVAELVTLSEVPPHFVDALLSMEDRRFYYHLGIDPIGLARAAQRNRAAGRIVEGGSTLTQQLIKYSFLSSDRTLDRKKKEAWLALSLELRLSKDEILERYMSSAYFGQGCYGLRAAARQYFNKEVAALDVPESAYLVALLKSPSYFAENVAAAKERAELVLDAMVENGKIEPQRRADLTPARPRSQPSESYGSYYADWVAGTTRVPETGDFSPLPVHTSFDPHLQQVAMDAVEAVLAKDGERQGASQAAMVVMRTDGRVLAMVGGRSHADSQFNRAVQARRQPGSSFKLFVYFAALRGGLTPDSTVVDKPIAIGNYEPENFGHRYRGAISVRQAFASSINTVAVRLSEAVGRGAVIAAARDLGITTPIEPAPSLALGSFEVSLLELTSAYCAVAAGAYPVKPWAITGFGRVDGQTLPPRDSGLWRLEEQQSLKTLLNGTVRYGSGRRAQLPIRAYGKTGTSQNYRDAWFIGFAGNLVVGVWVGNDDSSSMKRVTGGSLPAQIWKAFMSEAIRSDEHFESDLPEIAAFPRRARPSTGSVMLVADLETQSQSQPATVKSKSRVSKEVQDPDALLRGRWKARWGDPRGRRSRKDAGGFMENLFR